jgi:ankyrin repeat protein
MILILLGLAREQIVPRAAKMDRIDFLLVWTIKICLVALFFTLPIALADELPPDDFWLSCSGGKLQGIRKALKEHPAWVNTISGTGESCLHLAGIYGHTEVTELLLLNGADPNIRSTWEEGLRMHPLSWNVYGGHVENVKLLLEHGADVNADFDSMSKDKNPVTAMDIALQLQKVEAEDTRFEKVQKVLEKFGGKTISQLEEGNEEL